MKFISKVRALWKGRDEVIEEVQFQAQEGRVRFTEYAADWAKALSFPWQPANKIYVLRLHEITLIGLQIEGMQRERLQKNKAPLNRRQIFALTMLFIPVVRTITNWEEIRMARKNLTVQRQIALYEAEMAMTEDPDLIARITANLYRNLYGEKAAEKYLSEMEQVCDICGELPHRKNCPKLEGTFEPVPFLNIRVVEQPSDQTLNQVRFREYVEFKYGTAVDPAMDWELVWMWLEENFGHALSLDLIEWVCEVSRDLSEVRTGEHIVTEDFQKAVRLVAHEHDSGAEQEELDSQGSVSPGLGYPEGFHYQ